MKHDQSQFSPKTAIQLVRSVINFGERHGLARHNMRKVCSLSEDQLNDSRLLIDVQRYEALLAYLSKHLDNPMLGFDHGQQVEAGRWGVLGFIASTAQNFQAAIEAQYRFQSLSGNMGAPLQFCQGGVTTLQWVPAYNCSYHFAEQIVTGLVSLARDVTNNLNYAPNAVYFTHKAHANVSNYERYFQCSVLFDAEFNGLEVHNELLEVPLRKSDTETHNVLVKHAQSLLEEQTFTSPLEVIKDYVVKTLPSHVPDIEEVSSYLNLSVRSSQRKLQEYGTSYSQVLDAIRKELALTYLRQTQNSVLYISERLGFSEQSAFQRAFKRWTGTTPKRYRNTILIK
ncbi:AraC family transcriptional regulator ligand-binding domain-containing protein [Pseudomonas sp. HK3]